ncbi:MAG: SPOR domain-containing protein [Bacteroidetes bacterium]|nr:SPOR domain-containing protein [Bacteroidota bacterium]MBS1739996.1 SPOR domain-containing protein [Bacteroidota bacterium]MBS1777642.1 SPOR domain-containing protein [Bacteroidota bacterium]
MNKRLHIYLIAAFFLCQFPSKAQSIDDSTGVIVHTDPRLAILIAPENTGSNTRKNNSQIRTGSIHSGRGYRVQIYNGSDRHKANAAKVDFIRRFPSIRSYITYIQPQFRVKVGDFRSRSEAQKFMSQLSGIYSPLMVVPDIIEINTFKNDQSN